MYFPNVYYLMNLLMLKTLIKVKRLFRKKADINAVIEDNLSLMKEIRAKRIKVYRLYKQAHVGNQTGGMPAFVLYTDHLEKIYQRLKTNEVRIIKEPVISPEFSFLHFLDLYGNEIVLVQLNE